MAGVIVRQEVFMGVLRPQPSTIGSEGRKVLVVEDDPEVRDLECKILSLEGYDVVGVADGASVVSAIHREHPDVVLLDLMLPDQDGNAVLEEMSRDPSISETPVVVASAWPDELHSTPQVRWMLRKPFSLDELLDAVAGRIVRPRRLATR